MESSIPHFRLFDLPAELREQVLAFAVQSPHSIAPRVSIPRDALVLRLPPVTKVCRQVRKESLPLFFHVNTFQFNVKDVLEAPLAQDLRFEKKLLTFGAWCEAVGREMFPRIRQFELVTDGGWSAIKVCVTLGRFERVDVALMSVWSKAGGERAKEAKAAPESVEGAVRKAAKGGCLMPEDMTLICREMESLGPALRNW